MWPSVSLPSYAGGIKALPDESITMGQADLRDLMKRIEGLKAENAALKAALEKERKATDALLGKVATLQSAVDNERRKVDREIDIVKSRNRVHNVLWFVTGAIITGVATR
jgi:predicted RNase H-like nuclease (RuvC/YqgF family)